MIAITAATAGWVNHERACQLRAGIPGMSLLLFHSEWKGDFLLPAFKSVISHIACQAWSYPLRKSSLLMR